MQRSVASIGLSLLLLALLAGAGLWLLRRSAAHLDGGARGPPASGPERGAGAAGEDPAADEAAASALRAARGAAAAVPGEEERGAPQGASEDPISIEGRVSGASDAGISGARVSALGREAWEEILEKNEELLSKSPLRALRVLEESFAARARTLTSSVTAEDGAYALRGLPGGDHRVVVTHPEFLPHGVEDWIVVERGRTARYDVELVPGLAISGVVEDDAGRPLAGARAAAAPVETACLRGFGKIIQAYIDQTEAALLLRPAPAVTDASGAFRLSALAPGAYDLRVTSEGRAWGEARGVSAGSEEVRIVLGPALRVAGRVVSSAGAPVAGAEVTLGEREWDVSGMGPMAVAFVDVDLFGEKERAAVTDDEGRFTLLAAAAGEYRLQVRADGFPARLEPVTLGGAAPAPRSPAPGPVDLGDIILLEGLEVTGTVLSPDGRPVEGAEVWAPEPASVREDASSRRATVLEAGPESSLARAATDRRGAFRLAGLGAGEIEVAVLAAGLPGAVRGGIETGGPAVTIVLERGVAIRGTVVDAESGAPLSEAQVAVEVRPACVRTTDAGGRFEASGLRPDGGASFGASVAVVVSLEGYRATRETVAFPDPARAPAAEVRIALPRLEAPASGAEPLVHGVVLDSRGAPLSEALVWAEVPGWPRAFLRLEPGGGGTTRTAADGSFSLKAPQFAGTTFDVVASRPGLATARAGPFPQGAGAAGWPPLTLVLGEGVVVEGRVTTRGGAPVAGALVRFFRGEEIPEEETLATRILPPSIGRTTHSGTDGDYRLRRLEPGTYRVAARASGFAETTLGPLEVLGGAEGAASPGASPQRALPAGAPARIDIVLEPGGSLAGRVVDSLGAPLAGIEVVAVPDREGPEAAAARLDEMEDEVVTGALGAAAAATGADGSYSLEHLPPGTFMILARAPGFEPASTTVLSEASEAAAVPDLVLARHGRILGRVVDLVTGSPVSTFALRLERRRPGEAGAVGDSGGAFVEDVFIEDHRARREVVDAGGRFTSAGLRAGEWRVHVTSAEHVPALALTTLADGEDVPLLVALSPGARIDGLVLRPDGTPIAGASIAVERRSPSLSSGEDGRFSIAGLESGSYHLAASHPDHYPEDPEGAATVSVEGLESASVRLTLRPGGSLLGRIRGVAFGEDGSDIWVVILTPLPSGPEHQEWTDESGTFQRRSLRPGRYRLALSHRRRGPETDGEWISVPPEPRPLGEVEVRAGEMALFEGEAGGR